MQFVYVDQDTPAVVESVEFINERQKVEISVENRMRKMAAPSPEQSLVYMQKKTSKPGEK